MVDVLTVLCMLTVLCKQVMDMQFLELAKDSLDQLTVLWWTC